MFAFRTLDVFTQQPFGGNPLCVFPEARNIPESLYLSIAREMNLSETVFILPGDTPAEYTLRIFTPARELAFAGHPVVGSAAALAELLDLRDSGNLLFHLPAGEVPVTVRKDGTLWWASFGLPRIPEEGPPPPSVAALAEMLGIGEELMKPDCAGFSAGTPFLLAPLQSRKALSLCKMQLQKFETTLASYWAREIMPFFQEGQTIHARMFAPGLGIAEDPATGGAVAALAGWLARESADGIHHYTVFQGEDMGRPSRIDLDFESRNGRIQSAQISGTSVPMGQGSLRLP
ncbi:MAG: PhzF family phenazine biosynthesis protein [Leptospiraceae bacterium]|nr:PhzF family phenazine biosynthesis protein [Leptospiraceae bacterium]MCB1170837.1 PhzF family phenazine biosynthesis protein [Leptospiraceae bacterium]